MGVVSVAAIETQREKVFSATVTLSAVVTTVVTVTTMETESVTKNFINPFLKKQQGDSVCDSMSRQIKKIISNRTV